MAGIRGKNTGIERRVRQHLHAAGLRFRLHAAGLPGRPDIILRKHNALVFVHGCFWHMHNCALFKPPKTRADFWLEKLTNNVTRDELHVAALVDMGWRVAVVWECALRSTSKSRQTAELNRLVAWILSRRKRLEIPKRQHEN